MRYGRLTIFAIALISFFSGLISCSDITDKSFLYDDNQLVTRSANSTDYYYWYNGTKVGISSLNNLFYVSSTDSLSLDSIGLNSSAISTISNKQNRSILDKQLTYWKIIRVEDMSNNTSITNVASLISDINNKNIHVAPVFGADDENYISTSEYFYVKLKSSKDYPSLVNTAQQFTAEIVKEIPYMPNWYLLKSPTTSNGLVMSNLFYETGLYNDVDPAFMFNFKTASCPSEPDFTEQWGLNKINACAAWDITKGKSEVLVAVLDQGVDKAHAEFANNYSSLSYDVQNGSSPSVLYGNHGTHVGGIIGANHNGIKIAGLAPESTILSISHSLSIIPTISSDLASGIGYARTKGAAVINNSWGDQGGQFYANLHSAILEDAIRTAITSGRNGKGMVVVFASGNKNKTLVDYPASCNSDILVVGSANNSDNRSSFASYGTYLDVVAPGETILSTIPGNSTGYMSGTSMAAPHVSALAALILSVNPDLTAKEVVDIIEKTARKIGSYSYLTTSGRSNGTWNNEMGYGLIDAFAALLAANPDIVTFNDKNVSSNEIVSGWVIQSKNVVVANGAKLTFAAGNSIQISEPFTVDSGSQLELLMN